MEFLRLFKSRQFQGRINNRKIKNKYVVADILAKTIMTFQMIQINLVKINHETIVRRIDGYLKLFKKGTTSDKYHKKKKLFNYHNKVRNTINYTYKLFLNGCTNEQKKDKLLNRIQLYIFNIT